MQFSTVQEELKRLSKKLRRPLFYLGRNRRLDNYTILNGFNFFPDAIVLWIDIVDGPTNDTFTSKTANTPPDYSKTIW